MKENLVGLDLQQPVRVELSELGIATFCGRRFKSRRGIARNMRRQGPGPHAFGTLVRFKADKSTGEWQTIHRSFLRLERPLSDSSQSTIETSEGAQGGSE